MKKIFFSLFLLLSMSSCGYKFEVTTDTIVEKTKEFDINISESFIDCKNVSDYRKIEPINKKMAKIIDSLIYDIKSQSVSLFSKYRKSNRPSWSYQLMTKDTVFMMSKKMISVRILAYTFEGGAHGRTNFYSLNYSPSQVAFYGAEEILDFSKAELINAALERNFNNENGCFKEKPTLDNVSNLNVSEESVIFTYEHYVLGPYYCGYLVVEVPRKELKGCMKI